MSTATTFYFEEIYPNYETWKAFSVEVGVVDFNDPIQAEFDKYCYTILSRHFSKVNIRYFDVNTFNCRLANVYMNKFKKYLKIKETIDAIYQLTVDEYLLLQKSIANVANNPNDLPDDPTKPLNYISSQTYGQVESNKLRAYIDALNQMPTLNIDQFLRGTPTERNELQFVDLFMNVQPHNIYLYEIGG